MRIECMEFQLRQLQQKYVNKLADFLQFRKYIISELSDLFLAKLYHRIVL